MLIILSSGHFEKRAVSCILDQELERADVLLPNKGLRALTLSLCDSKCRHSPPFLTVLGRSVISKSRVLNVGATATMSNGDEGTAPGGLLDDELDAAILLMVEEVSCEINSAKLVDQVICALYSLAARLFPIDSSVILAAVDPLYASQVLAAKVSTDDYERDQCKHVFYNGAAFPAMARILLYNVTSHWLSLFSSLARKLVYDSFFLEGPSAEIIQTLVPVLSQDGSIDKLKLKLIYSNVERILVLCLLKKRGVQRMVSDFDFPHKGGGNTGEFLKTDKSSIPRIAQLLVSIPDKATLDAVPLLLSHYFFQGIVIQLLDGAEIRVLELYSRVDTFNATTLGGSLLFVGETFSRICRRGSAGILVDEIIPRILDVVQNCLSAKSEFAISTMFEKTPKSMFWLRIVETIKDKYAVERLAEVLLRQLSTKRITEVEAYWILWVLFNRCLGQENTMRAIFVDKFLIWKVFPVCCLRWIIQLSILEQAPVDDACSTYLKSKRFFDMVQRLVTLWSKRDFVQTAHIEQQAYITAAVGLCLEKMTNEELETTQDVLSSILQGVSCRLESPIHLIRKMGCSIALAFSRVVNPANPLYLEDICCESIDWDFGLISPTKKPQEADGVFIDNAELKKSHRGINRAYFDKKHKNVKDKKRQSKIKILEVRKNAPDMSIHQTLLDESIDDEEARDDESSHSESSSDSSLQPYDLSDDDADLQKGFSQLADVCAALRKSDDPEGIERALDVAEKLIRASPDELQHISGDLVRALVHVRCADVAVEGQEDVSEERRQRALVALIVTCPFESVGVLTKLLYSPNVDVSQRILVLDAMTEAAQELASATFITMVDQSKSFISSVPANQPWFVPNHSGPPGAGPWKEVEEYFSSTLRYERVLPSRPGQVMKGKSRRWSIQKTSESQLKHSKNKFPLYAAAFMLPAMQGYDKRGHGVDLLNRDFIVLGKLIHMLGVCMNCIAMHPEAAALASHLLDMLKSRAVAHHAEAYVRRSALFAATSILMAVHPSNVAFSLIEGSHEISSGLEWIRIWALHISESDPDTDCSAMAIRCLQLHSELALQTSRFLETAQSHRPKVGSLISKMKDIIIPSSNN